MAQVISGVPRSSTIFVVTCVMVCIATAFMAMRLISKLWLVRKPTWDDLAVFIGWILAVALSSALMVGSKAGLGEMNSGIALSSLKRSVYAFTILYNPALTAIKLSILILYLRMSQGRTFFRYATLTVGLVVILNGIVLTFLNIFQCRPISGAFNNYPGAVCIDIVTLYICGAPVNVLTDIAILVLPLPTVTAMRLDARQKVGLVATFMTGLFVTIIGVVRIAYLQEALSQQISLNIIPTSSGIGLSSGSIADFLTHASYSFMWSVIEVNAGLACACALAIKPLLVRLWPGKSHSYKASRTTAAEFNTASSWAMPPLQFALQPDLPVFESKTSPLCAEDVSDGPSSLDTPRLHFPVAPAEQVVGHTDDMGGNNECRSMDMAEFLATTNRLGCPQPEESIKRKSRLGPWKRKSSSTATMEACQKPPNTFMDFVNVCRIKPLTELTRREAWWPILFVSLVSWTQGVGYGLLNSLIGRLQSLSHYNSSQSLVLHNAYYCGYIIGPLVGYPIYTRVGFKATLMTGLGVFTVASLTFWPSSSLLSFPGFVVSNILIGTGAAIIQVSANSFIALAGPDELMEARINFGQGLQAIGTIVGPLLALKVLFKTVSKAGLYRSQWLYLGIALWATLLGVIVYYVPLSEACDEDFEKVAKRHEFQTGLSTRTKVWHVRIIPFASTTGILLLWLYLGEQQALRFFWNALVNEVEPGTIPSVDLNYYAISLACFATSRFLASLACYLGVPGRIVLAVSLSGCLATSLLGMLLPTGDRALVSLILLAFFEGPCFPTIFAVTLRGLGRHTKLVATGLTMAISGGAIVPSIAWAVQRDHDGNDRFAMRVSVIIYAIMLGIVGMVNFHPTLRHWVDSDRDAAVASEDGQDIPITSLEAVSVSEKRPRWSEGTINVPEHIEFAGNDHAMTGE